MNQPSPKTTTPMILNHHFFCKRRETLPQPASCTWPGPSWVAIYKIRFSVAIGWWNKFVCKKKKASVSCKAAYRLRPWALSVLAELIDNHSFTERKVYMAAHPLLCILRGIFVMWFFIFFTVGQELEGKTCFFFKKKEQSFSNVVMLWLTLSLFPFPLIWSGAVTLECHNQIFYSAVALI